MNQNHQLFSDIRGKGLLIGCELGARFAGKSRGFAKACENQQLLVLTAGPNVIRLTPSLIIPNTDIDEGLARFDKAMNTFINDQIKSP